MQATFSDQKFGAHFWDVQLGFVCIILMKVRFANHCVGPLCRVEQG